MKELGRMSMIVDHITPNSIVLFNESFASTTQEKDQRLLAGSYELYWKAASRCFTSLICSIWRGGTLRIRHSTVFRAERLGDARRTFRLSEGEPLPTSYERIFIDNFRCKLRRHSERCLHLR